MPASSGGASSGGGPKIMRRTLCAKPTTTPAKAGSSSRRQPRCRSLRVSRLRGPFSPSANVDLHAAQSGAGDYSRGANLATFRYRASVLARAGETARPIGVAPSGTLGVTSAQYPRAVRAAARAQRFGKLVVAHARPNEVLTAGGNDVVVCHERNQMPEIIDTHPVAVPHHSSLIGSVRITPRRHAIPQ